MSYFSDNIQEFQDCLNKLNRLSDEIKNREKEIEETWFIDTHAVAISRNLKNLVKQLDKIKQQAERNAELVKALREDNLEPDEGEKKELVKLSKTISLKGKFMTEDISKLKTNLNEKMWVMFDNFCSEAIQTLKDITKATMSIFFTYGQALLKGTSAFTLALPGS